MRIVLPSAFFERTGTDVALELLGKFLVRKIGKRETAAMITEVEVYEGPHDRASHGRVRTKRSEIMYGPAGRWYVYLCYGMYEMLNIVTGKKGHPAAILIRGAGNYSGPGKLTRGLSVTRALNGARASKASGLWIEDRGAVVRRRDILRTPRIGVDYAGPKWSKRLYRFVLKDRIQTPGV